MDAVNAFPRRRFRQQGYGDIGFDVVRPDIAGGSAVGFEEIYNSIGVAFGDVERYGYGLFAVERSVRGCGLRGELTALYLLNDAVEVGVHVGILGRADLALDGREILDSEVVVRCCGEDGCGCVGGLRLQSHIAIICQQREQQKVVSRKVV